MALSMARAAARSGPSRSTRECSRGSYGRGSLMARTIGGVSSRTDGPHGLWRRLTRRLASQEPMNAPRPKTIVEKIWDDHVIATGTDGAPDVLGIDLHLVHEVTSPQAFDGLRDRGLRVRRPGQTLATVDHSIPTTDRSLPFADEIAFTQVSRLEQNCNEFGIPLHGIGSPHQGIVHVIGPELGLTQPGMTIVCGDSHTATHGAFGALAIGIGTTEVEHVLATQTLLQHLPKTMELRVDGKLPRGVTAK